MFKCMREKAIMDNFSISNSLSLNKPVLNEATSVYAKLKHEYKVFVRNAVKSDLSNSVILKEKEIELLEEMKAAAIKENLDNEVKEIEERESEIKNSLTQIQETAIVPYYNDLVVSSKNLPEVKNPNQAILDNMQKAKIPEKDALQILDSLKVEDVNTGETKISESAVKSVIDLKKTLNLTRKNETNERNNPINKLGVKVFQTHDTIVTMKYSNVLSISQKEDVSLKSLKHKYNKLMNEKENNLLIDFVKKYKDDDGEINSKALRTITALRRYGVNIDELFNLTDFCIENGNINTDKLKSISSLKQARTLSSDIIPILNSVEKNSDGSYSTADIQNACALSSAVIPASDVIDLLPEVRNNEVIKDFIVDMSPYFESKSNLIKLLPFVQDENGEIDENAMSVIFKLGENLLQNSTTMTEKKFILETSDIISKSKNDLDTKVNDESAGICSIMCNNGASANDIKQALDLCKINGTFNEQLSDLLWDMSFKKADISQLNEVLSKCKNENGDINQRNLAKINSLLKMNFSIENIAKFSKSL